MHFPGELAHAAGALPLLLQEGEDAITVGLGSMFPFYCGYTRSVVDQALKGEYAFLDAILFGDHCVQLLGAADAIRCNMPGTRILFNQLISSMDAPWAAEQAKETFRQLKRELEEVIGSSISPDALRTSIKIFNKNRALIRRLYDLRKTGRLAMSAAQLQHIVKSSMVMDKETHTGWLEQLLEAIAAKPPARPYGVPIYLSGHFCQPPKLALLDLIEGCGATVVGDDPLYMLTGVIPATEKVLQRAGLTLADIDLFEVNEAFAPVVLAWAHDTGADLSKTNVNGGAIAIGHPLGASGARIMTTMVNALEQRGGRDGLQTMCEGGGMANATIVERLG